MDAVQSKFLFQDRMIHFLKNALENTLVFVINQKVENFKAKRIAIDRQILDGHDIYRDSFSCQISLNIVYSGVDLSLCFPKFPLYEMTEGVVCFFDVELLRDRIICEVNDHISKILSIKEK